MHKYLARRRAKKEAKREARRNRNITLTLLAMPDQLWERLGSNPDEAREYLRSEIR